MATKKKYNLLGAIRAMDEGRTVEGLEAEASREMERQCGRKADHGGIMIPDGALCREMGIVGLRDVTSTEGRKPSARLRMEPSTASAAGVLRPLRPTRGWICSLTH